VRPGCCSRRVFAPQAGRRRSPTGRKTWYLDRWLQVTPRHRDVRCQPVRVDRRRFRWVFQPAAATVSAEGVKTESNLVESARSRMKCPIGDDVKRAAEILAGGGLVAFVTETVYGLGAVPASIR
jgi:hypothetical protein